VLYKYCIIIIIITVEGADHCKVGHL